ncbi:MAG: thiamine pyrophosphate-dependent dehydrogenase E1 component subunit alpha [Actinomycetota bacterium]
MVNNEKLLEFFEKMYLVRSFENKIFELAKKGFVRGSIHLCIGEEAASVGTCMALDKNDYILPTHRGHGQELMKGSDPTKLMAEMIGKETGICKGRSGTMHIFDKENNNLGAQGILGAQFPIAIGAGLAIKLKQLKETLVMVYFGDGTSNAGNFYESLNMSVHWSLPIIFVCINNQYGMGTRYNDTCKIEIHKKAELFDIKSLSMDGNDIENIYLKTQDIVRFVKKESKPALIELKTYRISGHSAFDKRPYRTQEEIEDWKKHDPLLALEKKISSKNIENKLINEIKDRVNNEIRNAEKFALESNYPSKDTFIENEA